MDDRSRIYLRHDQNRDHINGAQDSNVTIYAFKYLRELCNQLNPYLKGHHFNVYDNNNEVINNLVIGDELTLSQLISISRNEPQNCNGIIHFQNYKGIDANIIITLKDLVKLCIIIGKDHTIRYGGYRCRSHEQSMPVYVMDCIGLQFQRPYNTGRLVLIQLNNSHEGLLDNAIYEAIVGEKRPNHSICNQNQERFISCPGGIYFDTKAYIEFVSHDLLLSVIAINMIASRDVCFKFLKYGTGFFAGNYGTILEQNINRGVLKGLETFFSNHTNKWIKMIELPFYESDDEIIALCKRNGVDCIFTRDDALKSTFKNLIIATTNCADPHSVFGNEMGYSSVDAAIATNLKGSGHKFNPQLNKLMHEVFI